MRLSDSKTGSISRGFMKSLALVLVLGLGLSACGFYEYDDTPPPEETKVANPNGIFGEGGIFDQSGNRLFGDENSGAGDSGRIGVNTYLWRASLDTVSFMPVLSVDPFGGVIITDWHSTPAAPNERFKLNVYILGRALRADGIKVATFRQVQDQPGVWTDAPMARNTNTKIEDAILTRARQLRYQNIQQENQK